MPENRWLLKEEPDNYHFDRLLEDGSTAWSGVRNNWAQKNMRRARKGDSVLYYHTGRERSVVGIARVASDPYPDPGDESLVVFDVQPVKKLDRPVTLAEIKQLDCFSESPLVRMGRLSVVPITDAQWKAVEELARQSR